LGVQIQLNQLSNELNVEELEYEPGTSPMLKFKIHRNDPTVALFSSGNYFLSGASPVDAAKEAYRDLVYKFEQESVNQINPQFEIRNIVCKIDFEREFDLLELSVALSLEHCEFNPEQSPGLFSMLPDGEGTFQIFRSGVVLSTGTGSVHELSNDIDLLINKIMEINVEFDDELVNIVEGKFELGVWIRRKQ
jgi:transcription initiation factor TFIID TATA-box-binding protein